MLRRPPLGFSRPAAGRCARASTWIIAAPKYRLDLGPVRPWLVPIGLEFIINSPPSNDTTYQTPGIHFAAGIEYRLADPVSIGVDARYNLGLGYTHVGQDNSFTTGGYLGFNF